MSIQPENLPEEIQKELQQESDADLARLQKATKELGARLEKAEVSAHKKRIARLQDELMGMQATFDLRWEADRRAIKRWQEAHPDRENVWPDHADMVVWLMEELDKFWKVG